MMVDRKKFLWGCLLLAAATAILFYPILSHDFLNLDDHVYVSQNQNVQDGLSLETIKWAFTTFQAEFYHPLTWISLLADTSLYGKAAKGYLTTNLLLHIGNTLLVFFVFVRMTGLCARSFLIAALFSLHPFHVETVAWISDRKDLLCTFFWFLCIAAYLRYQQQPQIKSYLILVILFILAILAKPMVITLPCVLLLLDFWPLDRISFRNGLRTFAGQATYLVKEKIPLFALAIMAGCLAIYAQNIAGGLGSTNEYPMTVRLANAAVSYYSYTLKTIWPQNLAVFYPYLADHSYRDIVAAIILLVSVSGVVLLKIRQWPYFAVGWFWFLGTLVPAIGLFKIGDFGMADRYTYIPIIGLFIVFVWGGAEIMARRRMWLYIAAPLIAIVMIGLGNLSWHQIKYWANSEALYRHALQVTKKNYMAHYGLGHTLAAQGKFPEAIEHFAKAAAIKPDKIRISLVLGRAMAKTGNYTEASAVFLNCIDQHPANKEARFMLGLILTLDEQYERAILHFSEALNQLLVPSESGNIAEHEAARVLYEQALELENRGQLDQAMESYQQILDRQPDFAPPRNRLLNHYLMRKDYESALAIYHIRTDPVWLQNQIVKGFDRWTDSFQ